MLRTASWLFRVAGYAVVGVLAFVSPPAVRYGTGTQAAGYAVLGLGLAAWALLDFHPRAARAHRAALPATFAVIATAAGVAASAGAGGATLIAFAMAVLMAAAGELTMAVTAAVGAFTLLGVEIGGVVFNEGPGTLLGFPLLLMVAVLYGRNRHGYRVQAEQSADLLAQYERVRAEQRRADVLDERARIAREIHDVLAHSLGALGIQVQAARVLLTDSGDVERALNALATAQRLASDGLVETRRAVRALRADMLPLAEEIARAGAEHAERYGVSARFTADGTPRPTPPETTVALLRTVQEALVNSAKHAPGEEIDITLAYTPDGLRLTVANALGSTAQHPPGAERPSTADLGYGLTGMRERLLLLHGTLDAGRLRDRWIVTAHVPSPTTRQEPETTAS